VYVLRAKTGELEQVTKDHDMLDDDKFLDAHFHVKLTDDEKGRLRAKFDAIEKDDELPAGFEREIFKMRNWVSSGLGESMERAKIDTYSIELEIGDRLIMTTDGIHDNLSTQETDKTKLPSMAKIARESETADECAAKLTGSAHDYANLFSYKQPREPYEPYVRAHRDDMTVAAVDIK
jgi:serine/threonine protein phosphatase PrpC